MSIFRKWLVSGTELGDLVGWPTNQESQESRPDENPFAPDATGSPINQAQPQSPEDPPAMQQGSDTKPSDSDGIIPATSTDLAFQKFNQIAAEIQSNERQINSLVINMPVEFADQRQADQARINNLRQRNQQILRELLPTAIESFANFPNTQPSVTSFLLQHLQMQITGQNYAEIPFNPVAAMRSYQRLRDGGVEDGNLSLLGYRINYVLNDFEAARLLLIEAWQRGAKVGQPAMDDLREITKGWHRELKFREADAKSNNPQVRIEMDIGDLVAELFEDQAPNTVANFISLVDAGFYNGLMFYQVTPTDVAVTGSPTNDGQGGPGYQIKCECDGENIRHHFTGVLTAFPLLKDAGGSRFLITKQSQASFNGKTTVFGRVVEGLENLYKIQVVDRTRNLDSPVSPTVINRITVISRRDHPYIPEKIMGAPPDPTRSP